MDTPDTPGRRAQEISTHSTMTRSLLRLIDRLRERGVSRVVMEATSDYWKPAFYLLEAQGFDPWLVNAKDVKWTCRGGPRRPVDRTTGRVSRVEGAAAGGGG